MVVVHIGHQRTIGWQDIFDKDEQCLFRADLNTSTDDIRELANREVVGDEIFFLVDCGDVTFVCLFNNYGNAVWILFSDPFGFSLALLCSKGTKKTV
jgi:hypothetical protein